MTAGYDGARTVPALPSNHSGSVCEEAASASTEGPALICTDLHDWLLPAGHAYQALLVKRPQNSSEFQQHIDKFAASDVESEAFVDIDFPDGISKSGLAFELPEKARRLAALAVEHGLPNNLGNRIQEDFQQIALVVAELAPFAKRMSLELDIVGERACVRWHRDKYVGRAVVTYNSCGTEFVADDNVNFEHLDCGGCDDLIRDEAQIFSADVGDILFMKGTLFPATANGLVHRSPPKRWHANGQVMNRLLLKVDVI